MSSYNPLKVYGPNESVPRHGNHGRKKNRKGGQIDRLNSLRRGTIAGTGKPSASSKQN
jgi:hypothetical protein